MKEKECTIENCDIFDFMAIHVGLTVIHPGGLKATRELVEFCHLDRNTKVVDIACGKGTSAIYFAKRYGCKVIGIDMSENLVNQAISLAKRKGLEGQVDFRVGDALNLPFSDNEFDVAVSQAMLVLVKDKKKAIQEALRVTKSGGYLGWLELSWKKQVTADFLKAVSDVLCAYCMQNVHTFEKWGTLFKEVGVKELRTLSYSLDNTGMRGMLADEGVLNTGKVMLKYLTNKRVRRRMLTMNKFFRDHSDYFGYGIYIGKK